MVNFAIFLNNLDEIRDLFKDSLWSGEKVKINKTSLDEITIKILEEYSKEFDLEITEEFIICN